ncbi:DUF4304 domain-containing protein [Sphingomonas sp. RB56-2]|uniref:DUF4304 domain-containing protein n=1 Tax=Sphingomonas brevis TaxID=2908206 RepID=A0ABT0S618_9SPHN|nr:DUF4304 domain-containing protein [Sphingomonas brevis]MCL6739833.1 DUF4304 domain-containing protein [Sphingomonas brevis]
MAEDNPFSKLNPEELDRAAQQHGFTRKGQQNWVRRTADFVQLVNLQKSQWSSDDHHLNFALWPLAIREPPTVAESKFKFRTRGEDLGASDLATLFAAADELNTLSDLRDAERAGRVTGLMAKDLRDLLT